MMEIKLPNISASKFAHGFVIRRAKRAIPEYLERFGRENISYLLENDRDLKSYLPKHVQETYRKQAKAYEWVGKLISDEDFIDMLPDWLKVLVAKHGEHGEKWLMRQIRWLRGFVNQ